MTPVRYAIHRIDPLAHLFHVRATVELPAGRQAFRLPAWIRGSYKVRDFARHVFGLRAALGDAPLAIERLDKSRFAITLASASVALIDYTVHAFDSSVREAFLDTRRGFFNGSSLFYCPEGFEHSPFEIDIVRPDAALCPGWKLATALPAVSVDADGFGRYRAAHYEELIDCPVEMAAFQRVDFPVDGVPHALVLSGRCEPDLPRLAADLTKICVAQRALFAGEPTPAQGFDRYLFLTQVTANGYGGLEHRTSTALVTARDSLPKPGDSSLRKGYRGFLGLASHEYFHLWNVKRITPQRFAESPLAAEAYTDDLWAYEGVTSYYDDLMLLRAGLIDAPVYLDLVAEAATRLERAPGRRVQTLAEASFEAWIKYYQPDENTPNAAVSYYVKGALVALCLDLTLRLRSSVTLDDVMRALWTRHGAPDAPAPERAIEAIAQEQSGLDLHADFERWLRGTDELPLAELCASFAVKAERRTRRGAGDEGGRNDAKSSATTSLGLQLRAGDTAIAYVFNGTSAEAAGLAAGDVLVAIDGLRLTAGNAAARIEALRPERAVRVHYFRGDELFEALVTPAAAVADTWTLTLVDGAAEELARRKAWLGS
jgi:predicted metalloprotease with PDZ domain